MLRSFVDAAASLVLGAACPGCGTPCARLCPACERAVGRPEPFAVGGRQRTPTLAAAAYAGTWRRLVVAYKERQSWWLVPRLGAALALATACALAEVRQPVVPLILVPMPSQPRSVRARGLDTTRLLARQAAGCLRAAGLPTSIEPSLRHGRAVADQSGLGEQQRLRNLEGALVARAGVPGVRVVVDDLTTTGASLAEACRALEAAGTPASACAVVAATPRRVTRR